MHLNITTASLTTSCSNTGSHVNFLREGVTWSYFLVLVTIQAAKWVSPAGDSDIFFVPRLCHIEKFIFHISLPSSTFTIFIDLSPLTKILTVLILAEGRTPVTYTVWNSVKWPCSSWVFVVPSCVWEVVGSIPVGTQIFCLSHAHVILKKIHMSKRCFTQGFPWLCFGHIHLIWKTKLSDSLRTSKFKVVIYTRVLYWKEHYS